MEEYYTKENAAEEIPSEEKEESEEIQAFANLIEVWSAVILYIDAGFDLVSSLPDAQLRYVCFYYKLCELLVFPLKNKSIIWKIYY